MISSRSPDLRLSPGPVSREAAQKTLSQRPGTAMARGWEKGEDGGDFMGFVWDFYSVLWDFYGIFVFYVLF